MSSFASACGGESWHLYDLQGKKNGRMIYLRGVRRRSNGHSSKSRWVGLSLIMLHPGFETSKCWKLGKMTPYSGLGANLDERVRAFLWLL